MLAWLVLLLFGCGASVTDYYPLKVGNRWVFTTTDLTDNSTRTDQELIVRRQQDTYFFDHDEILVNVAGSALINRGGYTLLKTPLKQGVQWDHPNTIIRITARGATYSVPAGTFTDTLETTWHLKRPDPNNPDLVFTDVTVYRYARGVGPIYYHYEVIRPEGKRVPVFKSELTRFENVREMP